MVREQLLIDKQKGGTVFNFLDYKSRKPFFMEPMRITVENLHNSTYLMVKNVVYKEKQILALKNELDPNNIVLVEGKIKNGQLINISKLPEEYLGEISRILVGTL